MSAPEPHPVKPPPLKHTAEQLCRCLFFCVLAIDPKSQTCWDEAEDVFRELEPSEATSSVYKLFSLPPDPDVPFRIIRELTNLVERAMKEERKGKR